MSSEVESAGSMTSRRKSFQCPDWYKESLAEFHSRLDDQKAVGEYFAANGARLGLGRCASMISAGPGCGEIDACVIKQCMPNLVTYYGVEPEVEQLPTLTTNIEASRADVETYIINDLVEEWEGPAEPVDLVFAFEMMYYVPDRVAAIKKFMSWLNPGGILIIGIDQEGNSIHQAAMKYGAEDSSVRAKDIRQDLAALRIKEFKEEAIAVTFDLRNRSRHLAYFFLHRIGTDKEVVELNSFLDELVPTQIEDISIQVFTLAKECYART